MRDHVLQSLKSAIAASVVDDLLHAYEKLLTEFRKSDNEAALNAAGKFVEHVLRAIEFIRTGTAPSEIKSVGGTVKDIERDNALSESLRILMPRVATAMIFDVRSKRGAAHVKDIDPRHIDAALAIQAASWVMSEFVRLYHVADEAEVAKVMAAFMRGNVPLIEMIEGELVVTAQLTSETEILLRAFQAEPSGIDRRGLGSAVKRPASTITKAIRRLEAAHQIHLARSGRYHITGPGERALAERLAAEHSASAPVNANK